MPQSHEIPPELLAEMTPAVRAFVTQLLARLGMNSSNSSMPPSSDRPEETPPKVEKPSTGKKRGGQAVHVKRERVRTATFLTAAASSAGHI
jgi:hypothetical protein